MNVKTMKARTAMIQISDRWARIFQLLVLLTLIMGMQMLFGDLPPVQARRRLYGGSDYGRAYDVKETADWGCIVEGYSHSTGGEDGDLYLSRTNLSGDTRWKDKPDTLFTRRIYSVPQTSDGYDIACGYSDNPKGHGGDDVWLTKYTYEIVGIREEYFPKHLSVFHESSNSFTEQTTARYELPQANHVDIVIYNHLGQVVGTLILNMSQHAGTHTVVRDGADDSGREVSTGVYFLKTKTGEVSATTKLVKLE